ncbi:hypothetical protein [Leuconostoc mesenteroides]|uniref:hypothetical protein n=1 Tax=Leuconostoc mesenteroides TaxID=1245 RepID=UPI00338FEE10
MEKKTVPNLYKNLNELSEVISNEIKSGYMDKEKIHTIAEAMKCISETIKALTK